MLYDKVLTMYNNKTNIKAPLHPAALMLLFWAFICLVYFCGPIYLTPEVSVSTFVFLGFHILLFVMGSILLVHIQLFKFTRREMVLLCYVPHRYLYQIIFVTLAIGICGELMSIYSKIRMVGGFNFASISELRSVRAQALLAGDGIQSGLLPILGFLTYPAGFVGAVACMIFYERLPLILKGMCYFFMFNVLLVAVCMGGRSPILVLLLLIGASFYVRSQMGESYIPRSLPLRMSILAVLVLFVAYSSYIWIVRAAESKMMTSSAMLDHAANVWGAHPRTYLLKAGEWLGSPGFVQSVLSSTFYFIQNLSISERLLMSADKMPTMYGAYQIDLVAALFRSIPQGAEFLKNGYSVLLDANVYGFFTGAWSGLYLDISVFSFLAALLWGGISGKAWLNFKRNPNLLTGVKYIFWSYSILISFVSSPFGFSNSLMIFLWFLVFSILSLLFARYKIIYKPQAYSASAPAGPI